MISPPAISAFPARRPRPCAVPVLVDPAVGHAGAEFTIVGPAHRNASFEAAGKKTKLNARCQKCRDERAAEAFHPLEKGRRGWGDAKVIELLMLACPRRFTHAIGRLFVEFAAHRSRGFAAESRIRVGPRAIGPVAGIRVRTSGGWCLKCSKMRTSRWRAA